MKAPMVCPQCSNMNLLEKGYGTERVEELLTKLFPNAVVDRFDRDEIKNFTQLNEKLESFHDGRIDFLVGTQMLSKGHNFKNVNLVVILGVDELLNFPDFRATERAYQLIKQVSGRAGRFGPDGKVVIQTLAPQSEIFDYIKSDSLDAFYDYEIKYRQACDSPPFGRLGLISFSSRDYQKLMSFLSKQSGHWKQLSRDHFQDIQLLGPSPSPIELRAGMVSWRLLIKSKDALELNKFLQVLRAKLNKTPQISIKIDVDPYWIS